VYTACPRNSVCPALSFGFTESRLLFRSHVHLEWLGFERLVQQNQLDSRRGAGLDRYHQLYQWRYQLDEFSQDSRCVQLGCRYFKWSTTGDCKRRGLNISGGVILQNVLTNAGTVTMTGAANLTIYNNGGIYLGGVYNLSGALWDIQTNASINCACYGPEFFNNAGTFRKSVSADTATVNVNFTNTATINAQAGILSFNGAFTTTGGTLAFGVSGLASFGQINVGGNVALNGTANVSWLNGFVPAVGNSFALLDYGSQSGTFANITFPPGILGQGTYGATVFSVTITNTTAPTNLPVFLSIKLANTNIAVISWPSSATNYSLQISTNLSSGSWSNITSGITTVSTNDVFSNNVNGKASFFRLHSP
jgi:hypothetical protein